MQNNQIRITLVKSLIGRKKSHKGCAAGLGIKRIGDTIVVADTPENRGMLNRISYLVRYEG